MIVICIYKFVLMCLCICVTLADFFTFLFTNKDPVSVYVVLYVIILIQILIRYNVKNLITACTRSLDFDLKIEKISLGWEGGHPPPRPSPRSGASLPRARSLRSLAFVTFPNRCPPPNTLTHGTPLKQVEYIFKKKIT